MDKRAVTISQRKAEQKATMTSLKNLNFKEKFFLVMGRPNDLGLNRLFNFSLMALILLNVCCVILETVPSLQAQYGRLFSYVESASVFLFTIEYLLRVWTSSVDERFGYGWRGKVRYLFSPFALIDFLAIAPSYFSLLTSFDMRVLRAMRLFRMIRLLKLARYSLAVLVLVSVFRKKKPELLVSLTLGLILMVFASSLMYFIEHEAQPDHFSSIPQTMWWAVSTLTTIGYGDVFPITPLGKFVGSIIAFIGVGLFALPAAILASGFAEMETKQLLHNRETTLIESCPYCGDKKKLKNVA